METAIDVTPAAPAFARMVEECLVCEWEIALPDPYVYRRSLLPKLVQEEDDVAVTW